MGCSESSLKRSPFHSGHTMGVSRKAHGCNHSSDLRSDRIGIKSCDCTDSVEIDANISFGRSCRCDGHWTAEGATPTRRRRRRLALLLIVMAENPIQNQAKETESHRPNPISSFLAAGIALRRWQLMVRRDGRTLSLLVHEILSIASGCNRYKTLH